jgi:hypothetical protein
MSKAGEVEEIIAELVAGGLRDPAWIANAYIERIDPDRRMPDLINGACAVHVHHIACQQLGIVEPKGSAYAKPVSSIRFKELRDALDSLRQHANALQMRKRPIRSDLVDAPKSRGT